MGLFPGAKAVIPVPARFERFWGHSHDQVRMDRYEHIGINKLRAEVEKQSTRGTIGVIRGVSLLFGLGKLIKIVHEQQDKSDIEKVYQVWSLSALAA